MRHFYRVSVPTALFFILVNVTNHEYNLVSLRNDLKDTIMNVDRDFSNLSVAKGTGEAFITYAAGDVILLRQGRHPVIGIDELKKIYKDKTDAVLKWEPVKAEVSNSGDLGYTFGNWELTVKTDNGKDTVYYGNYVTIWKKQPDGSWKFVLDGGTSTPPPQE